MRSTRSVKQAGLLAAALVAAGCTSGPPPPASAVPYEQQIQTSRQEKDEYFRTGDNSPIPVAERSTFKGLLYFPIDPSLHVPAVLQPEPAASAVIMLETSQNKYDRMRRVGTLEFSVAGTSYRLVAFGPADAAVVTRLFVPFRDLTTGTETYHGGRYLDLDRTPTGLYDLDFNRAYHPYCVYNIEWECPVPPRENRLPLAVKAGERLRQPAS